MSELLPYHPAQPARVREALMVVCVLVAAILNFVVGRDQPALPFWDENYYITNAERYVGGIAQISSHPPLGLMLIAAGEAWLAPNAGLDLSAVARVKNIPGDQLPAGISFEGFRLLPSLFAACGALVFYGWLRCLALKPVVALGFSSLYLFENALMVHLSAVHLEAFFLTACMGALWTLCSLVARSDSNALLKITLFGLFAGLASMVKLPGVLLWAPALWVLLTLRLSSEERAARLLHRCALVGTAGATFTVTILLVFWAHSSLISKPPDLQTEAGRQDWAAMSARHQDLALGQTRASLADVLAVSKDHLTVMLKEQSAVPKAGPKDSKPWLWPLHHRPQNYRWDSNGVTTRYVQLVGNLVNWSIGLVALVISLGLVVGQRVRTAKGALAGPPDRTLELLVVTYLAYMAAHLWIGTQRVMYLHHYLLPLLLTYAMAGRLWVAWTSRPSASARKQNLGLLGIVIASVAACLFYYPLTRHLPLTVQECDMRNGLFHVVDCVGKRS
jgi:dolichyl-phosphate-mannose--protein O-mannosyl transferase